MSEELLQRAKEWAQVLQRKRRHLYTARLFMELVAEVERLQGDQRRAAMADPDDDDNQGGVCPAFVPGRAAAGWGPFSFSNTKAGIPDRLRRLAREIGDVLDDEQVIRAMGRDPEVPNAAKLLARLLVAVAELVEHGSAG